MTREGQAKQQGIASLEDSFGERSFERTALSRRAISHEEGFAGSRGGDRTPPVMLFAVFEHVPNDGGGMEETREMGIQRRSGRRSTGLYYKEVQRQEAWGVYKTHS